ncbi:MAG: type II secretion system protein [Planctomycetes bacterium]|nr:type II secretion system protein [Planctomycetota bacterium]
MSCSQAYGCYKLGHCISERRGRGFTLVELLVVMAIVTILASLLMPALKKALDAAKTIRCLANEKQIGVAMFMYADNNDAYLPNLGAWGPSVYFTDNWWQVHVSEYTSVKIPNGSSGIRGTIFECPNYKLTQNASGVKNGWIGNCYATDTRIAWIGTKVTFARLPRISKTGRTPLVGDAGIYGGHYGLGDQYDSSYYSIRHEGMTKICVLFVDGHGTTLPEIIFRDKKKTLFTAYKD